MPLLQEEIKEMQKNQVHAPFNFTIGVALAFQPQKAIFRAVLRWTSVLHNEGKSYCWNLHNTKVYQMYSKQASNHESVVSELAEGLQKPEGIKKKSQKPVDQVVWGPINRLSSDRGSEDAARFSIRLILCFFVG